MVLGYLPEHDEGDTKAKISPKGVDDHRPPDVGSVVDVNVYGLIGRVDHEF